MKIENAINSLKASLVWMNWSNEHADAVRTVLLEVEKVKLLEEENEALRKRIEYQNN